MNPSTLLIRHGQVDSPMSPAGPLLYGSEQPLNAIGMLQMKKLGEALTIQGISPSRIYTSPFPRAIQSAQILKNELSNHPPIVIRENLQGGRSPQWEGRSVSQLAGVTEDIFSPNPYEPDIHGESLPEAYSRVIKEYQYLLDENKDNEIAIITHGEIVGIINHFERTQDAHSAGIDQAIGKAEALYMQRNSEGNVISQRVITPEFQPTAIEMKK